MSAYRLYHLDGAGRVNSAEWLEAADHESAIQQASTVKMKAVAAELWLGKQRIACLNRDGIVPDTE